MKFVFQREYLNCALAEGKFKRSRSVAKAWFLSDSSCLNLNEPSCAVFHGLATPQLVIDKASEESVHTIAVDYCNRRLASLRRHQQ